MRLRSLLFVGVASLALFGCETEEAEWVPIPYNLSVTAFARDLVRLSWDGSPDVEGYRREQAETDVRVTVEDITCRDHYSSAENQTEDYFISAA